MKVPVELLPAISKIVNDCEERLFTVTGIPVKVRLAYTPTDINQEALQNLVCEYFGIGWQRLVSTNRSNSVVLPRGVYWWLSRKWLGVKANQLAKDFKMHHTSVLHMCNKINDLMEVKDRSIYAKVVTIENLLSAKEKI